MKKIKYVMFFIFAYIMFYLYFKNPIFRHYYDVFFNQSIYKNEIFNKKIQSIKDLEGKYKIKIVYPEIYEIGLKEKQNNTSNWSKKFPFEIKIKIYDKKHHVIFDKIISKPLIMGLQNNRTINYVFIQTPLKPGKYEVEIKIIQTDFDKLNNILYIKPTGFL